MGIITLVNRFFLKLAEAGVVVGMAILAIVIPYEVLGRHVLGNMPPWSAELTTFALVWVSMLGAVIGLKKGYQIGIAFFLEKLPGPMASIVRLLGFAIMLVFLGVMVFYGTDQALYNLYQVSPAMRIPMAIPYAAIPVGCAMMFTVTLEEMLRSLFAGQRVGRKA
ncbi:MAG: TRAP transporter small permease [Thermanaeromonas sp.]|uniref:TRAP transporter small permease n=1 Tax=Thermanaeromonas sp. TaxID=2003697 RepID=UPI00243976B2|nr:TRAP transporter small permease [Thermanaeromonas sp.]MCG0278171.1 TRAP transporter small permease [Thermanaeromonas sp.]